MTSRRNNLIRTVVALGGDVAAGIALASVCVWLIEVAALGLFLSFLLWLITSVAALAVSQFVVHPMVQALLSESKLNDAVALATGTAQLVSQLGGALGQELWRKVQRVVPAAGSRARA